MAGNPKWEAMQDGILTALKEVGKKNKVVFENHGYTWGEDTCTFHVQATVTNASGVKKDVAREEFLKASKERWTGVKKSWLEKSFSDRGHRRFTVVGYNPNRRFSIRTLRDDGQEFWWSEDSIAEKMKKAA